MCSCTHPPRKMGGENIPSPIFPWEGGGWGWIWLHMGWLKSLWTFFTHKYLVPNIATYFQHFIQQPKMSSTTFNYQTFRLMNNPGFFQQIVDNMPTNGRSLKKEFQFSAVISMHLVKLCKIQRFW